MESEFFVETGQPDLYNCSQMFLADSMFNWQTASLLPQLHDATEAEGE